ncbi:Uncharacterised protein [Vibrio cholerae]|nr:Uncharacterised protein [Vibrio cholerae]CSD22796.1 Uncharacterised protein [Vibrio cholerae]
MMSCHAWYSAGRIKSFIAASMIAKFLCSVCLRNSTLVTNTPALAAIARPGSKISSKSRWRSRRSSNALAYSEGCGGSSSR